MLSESRRLEPDGPRAWLGWALLGWILLGAVFFGAVSDVPMPGSETRYNVRHIFEAMALILSALILLTSAETRKPRAVWLAAGLAFPSWLALQVVPLPRALVALVSPERVRLADELLTTPLANCDGLLESAAPAFLSISHDPLATFERFGYLFAAVLVFLTARAFAEGEGRRAAVLAIVALFAALESLYGIGEWLSDTPMILWRSKTAYADVATGTLVNRNHFAQLLYIGLGAALSLTMRIRSRPGEPVGRAMALRVTIGLLMGAHLAGIAASQSRAGLGIALLVLFVSAATFALRRGRSGRLEFALAVGLLLPVVLLAGPVLVERIAELPTEWSGEGGRGAVLRSSLDYLADYPLFGSGGSTFALVFGIYRSAGVEGSYNYAHNDYLETLLESGVPGLLLVLLPAALYLVGLRRQAAWRDLLGGANTPLLAALAGCLIHAIVDFGFQIPSNLYLFAFLAGAFGPRAIMRGATLVEPGAGAGRRPIRYLLPALACTTALPLVALSVARWPGFEDRLPWPRLAEIKNRQAIQTFADSRRAEDAEQSRELVCRSLDEQIDAARLVPANPYFWVGYALRGSAIVQRGDLGREREREILQSVEAAVRKGRFLDPWGGRNRERLMRVALATGDLPGAIEDARAVARVDKLSRSLVENLLEVGLPPSAVADIVEGERAGYVSLLSELLEEERVEILRTLVPADIPPSPVRCRVGWVVASALRRAQGVSAERFLRGCLETPGLVEDDAERGRLVGDLIIDYRARGELDRAEDLLPQLDDDARRAREEFELAYLRQDWPRAVARGFYYLDTDRAQSLPPRVRASVYRKLAEAQANSGELGDAYRSLERALYFDPGNEQIRRWRSEIERGSNPFDGR